MNTSTRYFGIDTSPLDPPKNILEYAKWSANPDHRKINIMALTEATKHWANQHQILIGVVLHTLEHQLRGRAVTARTMAGAIVCGVENADTIALRFRELMKNAFPEEIFDIRVGVPDSECVGG